MTESNGESDKHPNWFQRYGYLVYILIFAIAIGLFLTALFSQGRIHPLLTDLFVHLSAGMAVTALLFLIVNKILGFDLEGERQRKLDVTATRLGEAADKAAVIASLPQLVEKLQEAAQQSTETADKLKVFAESDLTRYCDQIQNIPNPEWYNLIEKANGDISLMSPSLSNWFTDRNRMKDLLLRKAISGTKIRFIIMGQENDVGLGIASLTGTRAHVGFYKPAALKENEELISAQLSEVNRKIQEESKGACTNYVELRKVLSTPIFVKTEFFGEVLHWSFFGYNLDGKVAPSFWCREKRVDDGKGLGLYQILRAEFETIWKENSVSEQIDVTPQSGEADNFGADIRNEHERQT
jgi:hypothetical protein